MPRQKLIFLLLAAYCLFTLSACSGGVSATPTVDTAPIHTKIAVTALALQTQTALALPTPTPTAQISPTLIPTSTASPTLTLLPGTPKASSEAGCDNVDPNILDVTIPDDTEISPGDPFVKTWRFTNLGPCTWNQDYRLIFSYDNINGDTNWGKAKPVNFPVIVAPGDRMEISIKLIAPSKTGTFRGVFRLQNDKGSNFGAEFWVQILVK